jgi:hypothetical protein
MAHDPIEAELARADARRQRDRGTWAIVGGVLLAVGAFSPWVNVRADDGSMTYVSGMEDMARRPRAIPLEMSRAGAAFG